MTRPSRTWEIGIALGLLLASLPLIYLWLAGRTTIWGDMISVGVPILSLLHHMGQQGEFFGWAPYAGCGMPVAAAGQGLLFYPPSWMFVVLKPERWILLDLWLHQAIAFIGAYRFLGQLRFPRSTAVVGALAYTHSAPLVFYGHDVAYWGTVSFLPWIMAEIEAYLRRRTWRGLARLTVLLALPILGGGWQLVLWAYLFAIGYVGAVYACKARRPSARILVDLLLVASLALGIAYVAIASLLQVQAAGTARSSPLSLAEASYNSVTLAYLPLWPHINFYGDLEQLARHVGHMANEQIYLPGLAPLVLTALALGKARSPWRRRLWVMLGISSLLATVGIGRHSPVYCWLYEHVSWFASLRVPPRCLIAMPLMWSLGVCAGLESLRSLRSNSWIRAGLVLSLIYYACYWTWGAPGWWPAHLLLVLTGGFLLLPLRPGLSHHSRSWLILGAVVVNGWSFWLHVAGYTFVPAVATDSVLNSLLQTQRHLTGPHQRVLHTQFPELVISAGVYGSASISPFLSKNIVELQFMAIANKPMSQSDWDKFHQVYPKEIFKVYQDTNPKLLQLLGVENIIFQQGVFPLERPGLRCWSSPSLSVVEPGAMADALLQKDFDPQQTLLLPSEAQLPPGPPPSGASAQPRLLTYANDYVKISVEGVNGWVTLSDTDAPGWVARVDGVVRRHYQGYGVFRSLPVYPGDRVVEYFYAVPGFQFSAFVTLGAILLTALMALGDLPRPRRPRYSPNC